MKYSYFNPSPSGRNVGDCAIRAVAKATGQTWEQSYVALCLEGYEVRDLPHSNAVFGRYLEKNGFEKQFIPESCLRWYTVADFCDDIPQGTYVLVLSGHVVCVVDGVLYDTWNSGNEVILYYFQKL